MASRGPVVPTEKLPEGWEQTGRDEERLVALPTMEVWGETRRYEDVALQRCLGSDHPWRLFFATRLTFRPPLAPGIGPAMLMPTVWPAVREEFLADLEERGVRATVRDRTERIRVDTGERASLVCLEARHGDDEAAQPPLAGFLACWPRLTDFRVAGGFYPTTLPPEADDLPTDPRTDEQTLLSLIRSVR
ncbi:hypothetical protein ACFQH3_10565 [Haladaptatus sp. GCM10025707]|uniref:hypothetical protein n=1 Tax=unclassified Haladaptatus TaxID=2622732 RepID=UPI0023E7F5D4|nr:MULTISPECIES: hypothetical protein [unclassified Haladaptatus]